VEKNRAIFDRATHLRSNSEALAAMEHRAHFVVLHKNMSFFSHLPIEDDIHNRKLFLLSNDEIRAICNGHTFHRKTTFLGLLDGDQPIFGVDLITNDDNNSQVLRTILNSLHPDATLEDTRSVAPLLDPTTVDNELVLHATAMAEWQRRSPFCVACGGRTVLVDGGTSRSCTACGQRSWPRQDPSMIAVVGSRDGQHILLGRSPRHPPGFYTALAGFVEAGETMEHAVAREVFEEAGIRIDLDSVRYVASQPWPFPQSTMIGFTAKADDSQHLNFDSNELIDAKWFNKDLVHAATKVSGAVMQHDVAKRALEADPNLELLIPPRGVLARTLIETWLNNGNAERK